MANTFILYASISGLYPRALSQGSKWNGIYLRALTVIPRGTNLNPHFAVRASDRQGAYSLGPRINQSLVTLFLYASFYVFNFLRT
jgi:hypothetical protein